MQAKSFFGKLLSRYLWLNIAAMIGVVILVCVCVKFGLDIYTRHGQSITVPNIVHMDFEKARRLLERDGLNIVVSDSGYNRQYPANCILAQNPDYGTQVKEDHTIYVTVNSLTTPTLKLPDIIDNSSSRAAAAKLRTMGFKLLPFEYVSGEKDWVYGVKCNGHNLSAGDLVPVDAPLTLVVGNGQYDTGQVDIDYSSPDDYSEEPVDEDPFEEVSEPPATSSPSTPKEETPHKQ